MIPRSSEEILKEYAAQIQDVWGNTPLSDPQANRSSNLVRLLTAASLGQSGLELAFEAFIARNNIPALEGAMLDAAGAIRGVVRKTATKSKATIMVTGSDGSVMPEGTELADRFGGKWQTQSDIKLALRGGLCAFGQGVVCAVEVGSFVLKDKELFFNDPSMPWIYAATNGLMLELGGEQESDQAYRNRILNRGPLAHIKGTQNAAMSAIYMVDGVNFARFSKVQNCDGDGWMFVVHGGSDDQICQVIRLHAGLGVCALLGSTQCVEHCSDVKFQRPCAVLLKLRVILSCECPVPDAETIKSLILSEAPRIARQDKFVSKQITRLHEGIDRVEVAAINMPLHSCPEEAETIVDPIDGQEIQWGTQQTNGICAGSVNCDPNYKQVIKLSHWQYGIIDTNHIEIIIDCEKPTKEACNECAE